MRRKQRLGEEIANSITHGIGVILSCIVLVALIIVSVSSGDVWRVVSLSIYGATLIFLYLSSTIYHALTHKQAKHFFEVLDHIGIYLLIAGTYTPIVLVSLRGPWGWSLFGCVWGLAVIGILLTIFARKKFMIFTALVSIIMGWLIVIAIKPLIASAPIELIIWLFFGGLFYTFGVIFYICQNIPYHHTIWHLFVLLGSACHFFGLFYYIAMPG